MIYSWFNSIIKGYLKYRYGRIQKMYTDPKTLQIEQFNILLENLKETHYGVIYNANKIQDYTDFRKAIPVVEYEDIHTFIEQAMMGEDSILWPGKTEYFAKSSGTTNDRSKFIPITDHNLFENHITSSWDAMSILYSILPEARIFEGKNLLMNGSLSSYPKNPAVTVGDVSAILLSKSPMVGRPFFTPNFEIALLSDWEEKLEKIADHCIKEDVVNFAGVPTWTIVLFNKILEKTGKKNMLEVWPNLKTYLHGGVNFEPYLNQFKALIPSDSFLYMEVYNASEGYFAFQDQKDDKSMLLLIDNAVFYEFIPLDEFNHGVKNPIPLWEVEKDKQYCIVVSTSSGLWRYLPGDTVVFTSIHPYRIKISGRSKHFLNVFGEEVMVSNTDHALSLTCDEFNVQVNDYTAAPIFMNKEGKGGHEWLVEFLHPPDNLPAFARALDLHLQKINSDYEAKRTKDIALQNLVMHAVPPGTFQNWLKSKGRVGGQHKVPRLSNKRETLEEIKKFIVQ
ncbi:MAG: GH3 auxin-responsive promoter family protein [Saprospiraceae bacterium]|nr:GH3 auxin-responsive promoter family protein [Saprospiraceae bacterium]MBK9041711.1 GH3 auxin-responsive promoter family protein [Saprospiraceae bacterium]